MIHIADPGCSEGVDVVVALCLAVGLILPDATLIPDDFDFVDPAWPENATCKKCIDAARNKRPLARPRKAHA